MNIYIFATKVQEKGLSVRIQKSFISTLFLKQEDQYIHSV